MTWWTIANGAGVLELDGGPEGLELELVLFWGDGEARAAWVWSQTGALAWRVEIGDA